MPRLTPHQSTRAREDAQRIWQGEWNRRIALLIVFYATVELILFAVYDTGTWDTPLLFVYLGAVSVMMVISHRNWFRRLEADLDRGEFLQVEGTVRFPHPIEALFTPALRYAIFLGDAKLLVGPDTELPGTPEDPCCAEVLPSTRIVVSIHRAE